MSRWATPSSSPTASPTKTCASTAAPGSPTTRSRSGSQSPPTFRSYPSARSTSERYAGWSRLHESFEALERLGHVLPPKPDPEVVPWVTVGRGRQQQHTLLLHQPRRERVDRLSLEPRKRDASRGGLLP